MPYFGWAQKEANKAIRQQEKAAKLLAKKDRKAGRKAGDEQDDIVDDDEAVFADFRQQPSGGGENGAPGSVVPIPPSPSSNSSLTVIPVHIPLPDSSNKPTHPLCATFGGEYTDGVRVVTNNDMYVLKITASEENIAKEASDASSIMSRNEPGKEEEEENE